MIKLNPRDVHRAWDRYVAACNTAFGAPNHHVAGSAADLETPPAQIPLAAKFVLAEAFDSGKLARLRPDVLTWLKYLPRFINDRALVTSLNTAWASRSRGEALPDNASGQLDAFLRESNSEGERLVEDCTAFVQKVKTAISKGDRLFFHKTCALLGVDYDEPSPSLLGTIWYVLFPSRK